MYADVDKYSYHIPRAGGFHDKNEPGLYLTDTGTKPIRYVFGLSVTQWNIRSAHGADLNLLECLGCTKPREIDSEPSRFMR